MKATLKLLQDMLEAIATIESFRIPSYEVFLEDGKTQDAVMYNLIIMGEAANQISSKFQEKHPEIPWPSIIGTRNVIVHGYDQVKLPIVWDIIHRNLPVLKKKILRLVEEEN